MICVAGVADRICWNPLAIRTVSEAIECPPTARLILHMNRTRHDLGGLVVSALVNRSLAPSNPAFEHKHGLIWPFPTVNKSLVCLGIHEDVVKHGVLGQVDCRAVIHI